MGDCNSPPGLKCQAADGTPAKSRKCKGNPADLRLQASGFRVQGLEFKVQSSGFRV